MLKLMKNLLINNKLHRIKNQIMIKLTISTKQTKQSNNKKINKILNKMRILIYKLNQNN